MMTGIDDDTKNSFTQQRRQQIESTSAHIPHCFRESEWLTFFWINGATGVISVEVWNVLLLSCHMQSVTFSWRNMNTINITPYPLWSYLILFHIILWNEILEGRISDARIEAREEKLREKERKFVFTFFLYSPDDDFTVNLIYSYVLPCTYPIFRIY